MANLILDSTRLLQTDSWQEMAKKIYENFEVLQSCSVSGFICEEEKRLTGLKRDEVFAKGQVVWDEITRMDREENFTKAGRRKRRYLPMSNGAEIANKLFRYSIVNNPVPKWTIWRVQ